MSSHASGRAFWLIRLQANLIDVREVIARHSPAEHAALADAYFAAMPENPLLLRKPFFGQRETVANMHGLSEVLRRLQLFPGAKVMDFGAGTGWLSKALACIDCHPVAVDLSATALAIGRKALERDPVAAGLPIDWRVYDGLSLPLDDASLDRIVCFDSFHHVADQAATLAEFHRVLRRGGLAVFREPGPKHSTSADAQFEMRKFGVVENDIVLEDIWRLAEGIGFCDLRIAATIPRSATFTLEQYTRVLAGEVRAEDVAALMVPLVQGAENLRIFSIEKGSVAPDSRQADGLAATLELQVARLDADGIAGRARVTNTGRLRWRPSSNEPGGVCLGVQELHGDTKRDFGRVWLSGHGVEPGQTVDVAFDLPVPWERPTRIQFDLVSEHVTWFEAVGSMPVVIHLP